MSASDDLRDSLNRRQCVGRALRKPKPVVYLDLETRSTLSLDPGCDVDVICGAYKIGDGLVHVLPWEAACARKDWAAYDCLHAEIFAEIRRPHRLAYAADLRDFNRSWLARKFLTFAAWACTLLKR